MNTQIINETYYKMTVFYKLESFTHSFDLHDDADKMATNIRKMFNPDMIIVEEVLVLSIDFNVEDEFLSQNEEIIKTEEY